MNIAPHGTHNLCIIRFAPPFVPSFRDTPFLSLHPFLLYRLLSSQSFRGCVHSGHIQLLADIV